MCEICGNDIDDYITIVGIYCYFYFCKPCVKNLRELDLRKKEKGYRKLQNPTKKYDYMFPTSHDIFPENLKDYLIVVKKILKAGNTVLITTKPNYSCIVQLCEQLRKWKKQICFRFTITSIWNDTLKKYEPNAPSFFDRRLALKHAYLEGYKTSVSIEPFLDEDPTQLIEHLEGYVTDTIWLGLMSGRPVPKELHKNYTRENLGRIIEKLNNLPRIVSKVRLKDSIRNMNLTTKLRR